MRFIVSVLTAAAGLLSTISALPTETTSITLPGADAASLGTATDGTVFRPALWSGQLKTNGPMVNITGTSFQQIFDYVNQHIDQAIVDAHLKMISTTPKHITGTSADQVCPSYLYYLTLLTHIDYLSPWMALLPAEGC